MRTGLQQRGDLPAVDLPEQQLRGQFTGQTEEHQLGQALRMFAQQGLPNGLRRWQRMLLDAPLARLLEQDIFVLQAAYDPGNKVALPHSRR